MGLADSMEEFAGKLQGNLRISLDWDREEVDIGGDLKIQDLAVIGGPFGKGRGVRSAQWVIRPNVKWQNETGELNVFGTVLDLGFAKLRGLSGEEMAALEPSSVKLVSRRLVPLGMEAQIDLQLLAEQPGLLPKGDWKGKVKEHAVLFFDPKVKPGDHERIPFAINATLQNLVIPAHLLPENAKIPTSATLKGDGHLVPGEKKAMDVALHLASTGIDASAELELASESQITGKFRTELSPKQAPWFASFLPEEVALKGKSVVTGKLAGGFTDDADPLRVLGSFSVSTLTYSDNELKGLSQDFSWQLGGKAESRTVNPAELNGGPLTMSLAMQEQGAQNALALKVNWSGGRAAYGLTPLLRYAFPLLAGLPADDEKKIAGIDFHAIMSLDLEASGPLPSKGEAKEEMYRKWNGNGTYRLANGGFTPSSALTQLFSALGQPKQRIDFDQADGTFQIENGKVHVRGLDVGGKDGHLLISGTTGMQGALDHNIDFTDWLKQHTQGRRALAALGNKPVAAKLSGDLTKPRLEVADFAKKILENGARSAIEGLLKGLGSGKKPKDVLRDLLKGWKKK